MIIKAEKKPINIDHGSQHVGSTLKEIEINILHFVHNFGFCNIKQIMKKFDLKRSSAYAHMQMLTRLGLILHDYVIQDQHGAYYLTYKAISLLGLDLPAIRKIPLSIYEHQLAVVDVHLALQSMYSKSIWISERRLVREKYGNRQRSDEHLPDGVILLANGNQCAIEVEKSLKAKSRLEKILLGYGLQDAFKEVWYFCLPEIMPPIEKAAAGLSYVKTHNLVEFLL